MIEGPEPTVQASEILLTSTESQEESDSPSTDEDSETEPQEAEFEIVAGAGLAQLEAEAVVSNPDLIRLQQEAAAAAHRARYVDKLPDPTLGLNVFGSPIETASGSQRANLSVTQMIPWLSRLDAREQEACYEALRRQQVYRAAHLRVIADLRTAYYRLYVLGKQIEINEANQQLIESLIETATARIADGTATQGDVLLGTLELSRLQEQLLTDRQLVTSITAELNRLRNRSADAPVEIPQRLDAHLPPWQQVELRDMAWRYQPEIAAAQLDTNAARWGLEVARRGRRPDFSIGGSWYFIDDNRPATPVVSVGEDAWSVGASVSVPLWHSKYDAMEQEATWKHLASQSAVADAQRAYDARLQDLLAQAQAADETARLYQSTILPQARQTLEADQQSYAQNSVEFDRVIEDVRNLLTLELGYHRALGQLATALARIQQAVGGDLPVREMPPEVPPVPPAGVFSEPESSNDLVNIPDAVHNQDVTDLRFELTSHEFDVTQDLPETSSRTDDKRLGSGSASDGLGSLLRKLHSSVGAGSE